MEEQPGEIVVHNPIVTNDQRHIAAGALLNIAQDGDVPAALRIQAGRLVLYGPYDDFDGYGPAPEEEQGDGATEEQLEQGQEELIEKLARRVAQLVKEQG